MVLYYKLHYSIHNAPQKQLVDDVNLRLIWEWPKQWIEESLVNFSCEAELVSKQDALIARWTETMLSKVATFPYIHWVDTDKSKLIFNA